MAVILRAAERRAVPWKNGGGLTREVAAHPPQSDLGNFDWRVSLAEVRRGGPFSSFPGIDRHMAVISGRLELSISGRGDRKSTRLNSSHLKLSRMPSSA